MAISTLDALNRLASVNTMQQLTDLLLDIEMASPSGITLLYSGNIGAHSLPAENTIKSNAIATKLATSNSNLSIIDQTAIGKFLIIDRKAKNANLQLIAKLNEIFQGNQDQINAYLYGSRDANGNRAANGIWDLLSARFVQRASGNVITLTGGARRDGVFAQVELPQLLRNPAVTSIDGIPTAELRRLAPDQAFALVTAASEQRAANLRIPVDANGLPLPLESPVQVDSRAFLADLPGVQGSAAVANQAYRPMADFIPPERLRLHQEDYRNLRPAVAAQIQLRNQPQDMIERLELSRLLGRIDDGLAIYGLALAALEAKQALDGGDSNRAQQILYRWALENGGALLAGRLVGLMAAPLVAAGPLGLLLAGGLSLGASMAGSSAAEPAMRALISALASWTDATITTLQGLFGNAEGTISPLVLDLDGNGVISRSINATPIHFDHDGNGFAERTGWVGAGDGLLVRDLDGNGRITNGNELFGNATRLASGGLARNGFEALRSLDANGDGQVDSRDSAWQSLRVWVDRNADALTDGGELLTPEQVGVASLLLTYTEADLLDGQGNRHRQLGAYLSSTGSRRDLTDVWFAVDVTRSRQANPLPVPAAIAALPDLAGMGTVASLHQVMAANPLSPLPGLLEQWRFASSAQRAALIEPILFAWTGVEDAVLPGAPEDPRVYRRILALERLMGRPYRNVTMTTLPAPLALAALGRSFATISREFDLLLSAQVDLPPLLQRLSLVEGAGGSRRYGAEAALAHLRDLQGARPDGGVLFRIKTGLSRMGSEGAQILEALLQATGGRQDSLSVMWRAAVACGSLLSGTTTNDGLNGGVDSDWIEGFDGHDQLVGWAGNDVLVGGRGDDTLSGGLGNDLYLIERGEGNDRISDADGTPGNCDELRFVDIASAEVLVERLGPDLALIQPGGERVLVLNHFGADWARIERVSFSDGVAWEEADLRARAVVGGATAGNDQLGGYGDMVNRIAALGGNDTLTGGNLADYLDGGPGNDIF
ncbi:MAG: calcium-binding protein, partial [Cyanobium sp. ELA507]